MVLIWRIEWPTNFSVTSQTRSCDTSAATRRYGAGYDQLTGGQPFPSTPNYVYHRPCALHCHFPQNSHLLIVFLAWQFRSRGHLLHWLITSADSFQTSLRPKGAVHLLREPYVLPYLKKICQVFAPFWQRPLAASRLIYI